MRSRILKPDFFKDEVMAGASAHARLLFMGLWCMCDREGRLEDRPNRIAIELFPWERTVDVNALLNELAALQDEDMRPAVLVRYEANHDGKPRKFLQIINFTRHQKPYDKEAASVIPPCNPNLLQQVATSCNKFEPVALITMPILDPVLDARQTAAPPPIPPAGEPAAAVQGASPTPKPKRKPASKTEPAHPEYEACCAELPGLWNAAADVAGLDRSPEPMTKSLRRQVQLLMAESELFCQHWRELPKAFAACRWSTSRHVGISVALRTRWGNKPGVPFEDKYMAMLSAQQRGETTNAGGWTRDSDREF